MDSKEYSPYFARNIHRQSFLALETRQWVLAMINESLFLELKRQRLRQWELAKLADVSENTISKVLNGRVKPSRVIKHRIANALKLPVQEIFGENEKPRKSA